jgi:hypothetical protein
MTNKEQLIEKIQDGIINDEVARILNIITNPYMTKSDLLNAVYSEDERRKVDTAYPQPYADQMRELNPNFRGYFMVFDYNTHKFGAFENVAERVILDIINKI